MAYGSSFGFPPAVFAGYGSVLPELTADNICGSPYYSYWYWTAGNWWNTRYWFPSLLFDDGLGLRYGITVPSSVVNV